MEDWGGEPELGLQETGGEDKVGKCGNFQYSSNLYCKGDHVVFAE